MTEPKPPADTSWVRMEEIREGPGHGVGAYTAGVLLALLVVAVALLCL